MKNAQKCESNAEPEKVQAAIFHYIDYRKFLRDRYEDLHKIRPAFTYRFIADSVGLKSPGHITSIFNGSRNLTLKSAVRFARTFGLLKAETVYLQLLIQYNNADSHADKKYYFDRIVMYQQRRNVTLDISKYKFYEKWYYSAIRELVEIHEVRDNYHDVAHLLTPSIAPAEAKRSVEVLESLGLIKKDGTGRYRRVHTMLTSGEHDDALAIKNFQMETARLGMEALDRIARPDRDISTVTISISAKRFDDLREMIADFRQRALTLAATEEKPEKVLQLNVQLFPLTRNPGEKIS